MKYTLFLAAFLLVACCWANAEPNPGLWDQLTGNEEVDPDSGLGRIKTGMQKAGQTIRQKVDEYRNVLDEYRAKISTSLSEWKDRTKQRIKSIIKQVMLTWTEFKNRFKKAYSKTEEFLREKTFAKNAWRYAKHNEKAEAGEVDYAQGVHKYSDLSPEEMHEQMASGTIAPEGPQRRRRSIFEELQAANITETLPRLHRSKRATIPQCVDWRKAGAVTPVKDQGRCGSCWSFATTGVLEGLFAIKNKRLQSLSEQHLIDCASKPAPYQNNGCHGGWYGESIRYLVDNGGTINRAECYPYEMRDQNRCRAKSSCMVGKVQKIKMVEPGDEAVMEAIATHGPVLAAIKVPKSMQDYRGGIYTTSECRCPKASGVVGHAVLIVGYCTEGPGKDFWIVKNTWSEDWGEDGYIRLPRGRGLDCCLNQLAAVVY